MKTSSFDSATLRNNCGPGRSHHRRSGSPFLRTIIASFGFHFGFIVGLAVLA